ncbi:MAG: TolC family protein [Leptospirales bacterium]|nr:TolC family protein [Leptospirales bacterium]
MKTKMIFIQIIAISFIVVTSGFAQNEIKISSAPIEIELADEPGIIIGEYHLTLPDAIRRAIENNHDILTGKYDVAMTDTYYQKFLSKYSTYFSASGGISSTDYPPLLQNTYGKNAKSLDLSASLAKIFSTGTTIAGGITTSHGNTEWQTSALPKKTYNPVLFVSLEQELLKNSFGYNDRKLEEILKNTSLMQKDEIIFSLSLVIVGVVVDYWNIIVKKSQLDNATLMLQETRKVRKIVSDNTSIGLAEAYELNYWNSLIAASEAAVAQYEQEYREAFRKFLQSVNMDSDEITMQNKAILQNKLPELNNEIALKKAYEKRADYLYAVRDLENAKLQLSVDSNEALPSLTAGITVSSMDYNGELDESYSNTARAKYPAYQAQVTLTYPLDNSDQKVNKRNSEWRVEQTKYQVEKYKRLVKDDISSKIERVNANFTLYQKSKEARTQAGIYHDKMLTNLRRGRLTAAAVRNSLDALVNSRQQELQSLILFNVSLLEFEVAKNELFETYSIDVEKYIPKED